MSTRMRMSGVIRNTSSATETKVVKARTSSANRCPISLNAFVDFAS